MDSTYGLALGLIFLVYVMFIFVFVMFIMSMDRLIQAVRIENNEFTQISRAWAWTQLIPAWNFIAFIVFHIKMINSIRVFEVENKLQKFECKYPTIIGWILIASTFFYLIPFIGPLILLISFILFWINIVKTKNFILSVKTKDLN